MREKKVLSKSLLLLAITSIMLFAMSITSFAASTVTNVTQTDSSESSVTITYSGDVQAYGYYVYYSKDNKSWVRKDKATDKGPDVYASSGNEARISGLDAGTAYYVMLVPVYRDANYNYTAQTDKRSGTITVVTTPKQVTAVSQTKATASTVTLKWAASAGANRYYVYRGYSSPTLVANVTGTTATIKAAAGSEESYYVFPVKVSALNYRAISDYGKGVSAKAAPGKVSKLASAKYGNLNWKSSGTTVTVYWDRNANADYTPDGYKVEIYSVDGKKKLKTYNITKKYTSYKKFNIKSIKNKGFKIRVCGYVTVNGKKCYGSWSSKVTVIPQGNVKLTQKSKTSMKVSWSKVANATSYTIYACKNTSVSAENQKWYKVKTVSKKTTSYTVKNLKTSKYAGFYVIPTVKIGGKKYKADAVWYSYMYMSKYY